MRVTPVLVTASLLAACATPTPSSVVVGDLAPPAYSRDDSLTVIGPGRAWLSPIGHIADERIGENSGLAYVGGYWWTHNDSGGDPAVYRAATSDFSDAQRFDVPGAAAIDWEELTVLGDDLLICDVGDNRRERDDVTLYRVRPTDDGVSLVATYPIDYPDGDRHDCEGAIVIDGAVHLIVKNRGETETTVFRFAELTEGAVNMGVRVGALDMHAGEQITAAARLGDEWIGVLTYSQLLLWPATRLDGPPDRSFRLHARQCEALEFVDGDAHFTNEQRDVYRVDDVLACRLWQWETPRPELVLARAPAVPYGFPPDSTLTEVPLLDADPREFLRVGLSGEHIVLSGRMAVVDAFRPTDLERGQLGTAAWIALGTLDGLRRDAGEVTFAVAVATTGNVVAVPIQIEPAVPPSDISGTHVVGTHTGDLISFRVSMPVARAFPEGLSERVLLQAIYQSRARGEQDARVGGLDLFSIYRPYTWGVLHVPK